VTAEIAVPSGTTSVLRRRNAPVRVSSAGAG